jgi:hypothetical protein
VQSRRSAQRGECDALQKRQHRTSNMDPLILGLLIGFFGIALYVAIDTYEPNRTVAFVLKCLVVMWGGAAVIHCTGLFGAGFF